MTELMGRAWAARSLKLNWLRSCRRSSAAGAPAAAGPSSVARRCSIARSACMRTMCFCLLVSLLTS